VGIQILEYNRSMLHHKVMVVDGIWSTIGTTNFDSRSFAHNEESNVCVHDRGVATDIEKMFERDSDACAEITLAAWEGRGWLHKGLEVVASLFEDQV
jgi:cardiolipin synthase